MAVSGCPMHDVLIIDDNLINLTLSQSLIEVMGNCHCRAFTDPRAGLEAALAVKPDLLIVDYLMPDLDGLALVTTLRRQPGYEALPVLMLSAAQEEFLAERASEAGVNQLLAKPVDSIDFLRQVRRLLATSAALG